MATVAQPPNHLLVAHLTQARQRAGLSAQDVADRCGVTRQAVSAWENSAGGVHLATLTVWAAALGLRLGVQPGTVPVLRRPDGQPAQPKLTTHALLSGAGRYDLLPAVLAELPGIPHTRTDRTRHLNVAHLPRTDLSTLLGQLATGGDGCAQALVVDLDTDGGARGHEYDTLADVLSRARSNGVRIIALAGLGAQSLGPGLAQNLGLRLDAPDGSHAVVMPPAPAAIPHGETWTVA